ncbi:MAG: ATP-binding protein, partial [Proteobacteria bacterium]|nr:ATP-binding protein [Pseudomonadota bacterium]
MYFSRPIDDVLKSWTASKNRRPLVLRGARQTGKTAAAREIGAQFECFLELNLERRDDLSLFRQCETVEELLSSLRIRHDIVRFPPRTLIFIDEIQESPKAIKWLRFLYEDHPELAVITAGSLMEVRLQERGFSFPVGRVTYRYLHPFTFIDFLKATTRRVLAEQIEFAGQTPTPLSAAVHNAALSSLREYLLVGGMPAAVNQWVETNSPTAVRQIHTDLLQSFADDLLKYGGPGTTEALHAAFDALPLHCGARFKYENFAPGHRSKSMKLALTKLEGAMLIERVLPTSSFAPPFQTRPRSAPKLMFVDV